MPDAPPTDEELELALPDLFYSATQCVMYHFWFLGALPVLRSQQETRDLDTLIGNGVTEATLLFVRKSVEFFKPLGTRDQDDTIYSYRYHGYAEQEWILPKDTIYLELHKRVGHVTIRETRYGKMTWEIFSMVIISMKKWARFFELLAGIPSSINADRLRQCSQYHKALTSLITRMERDVEGKLTSSPAPPP
jgi:hypothetical protein